jgi:putative tryptophan/tyrosine transport system substrate-binding protein
MKRGVRVLLAFTAFPLIAAFCTGASWAQTKIMRVGVLNIGADNQVQGPFYRTLREHGWVEGKNVVFERRDAAGDSTRLAEPAAELVRLKVDVLFPVGPPSVRAAFAATRDIPIVAHDLETDQVAAGRGNFTGVFLDAPELAGKWVELLKTIVPSLSRVVVLWDPTSGPTPLDAVRKAALVLGVELQVLEIHIPEDIDNAPSAFRGHPQAMIVLPSPMMWYQSARLAQLATKYRLPATSMFLPFTYAGGLLTYGPDMAATFERCAVLLAKVLGGAKPGDLPIERPTKFEFVLNLKTARDFHLIVPDTVLLRANRIIQK